MRILHVASSYPLVEGDAHAPFMEEMLQALAGRGHEVRIVVPRADGLAVGSRNGVEVIAATYAPRRLQTWGYGQSLGSDGRLRPSALVFTPVALSAMAYAVRREIRRSRPDIVHLHWVVPVGALITLVPRSIPAVVSAHGADARFAQRSLRPVARRVLHRANALVAASPGIVDAMTRVLPEVAERAVVIPHGADSKVFHPADRSSARSALGLPIGTPVILAIGRLVAKKGFAHLIRAVDHLENVEGSLYIIGDGPDDQSLRNETPAATTSRVHLMGSLGRTEVALWMAASDVVVIPSLPIDGDLDSGPVVLMEALAVGRPVVASRVGMAPQMIEDGENGYLVDAVEPANLARAIDEVLASGKRMDVAARQSFDAIGGWDRVAEDLEGLYLSLDRLPHDTG